MSMIEFVQEGLREDLDDVSPILDENGNVVTIQPVDVEEEMELRNAMSVAMEGLQNLHSIKQSLEHLKSRLQEEDPSSKAGFAVEAYYQPLKI